VSSVEQNTDRQLEAQELDKVFTDRASGKDTKRPQLQAALDYSEKATNSLSTAWIG
jgi:DNA invertase Pin-like site-specific DNA recombinase